MHRFRSARVKSCETPLDPFLYLDCDPSDSFEVKDKMGAGRGLFAARSFQKSFLLNYRGTIKSAIGDNSDNVYTFLLKQPENVIVDASERPDCLARYINDIDCFHSKNCEVKVLRKDKKWAIAFFATTAILEGEELRYSYGSRDAPWRKESFWTKVCGLATQAPKNNMWEKRRQDEFLKEDDVSGTIANKKKKKMPITELNKLKEPGMKSKQQLNEVEELEKLVLRGKNSEQIEMQKTEKSKMELSSYVEKKEVKLVKNDEKKNGQTAQPKTKKPKRMNLNEYGKEVEIVDFEGNKINQTQKLKRLNDVEKDV